MSEFASITIQSGNDIVTFTPQEYSIEWSSLAGPDSGRSQDGTMHINWILRKTTKLEVKLPPHKYNDPLYRRILSLIQGQDNLKVTFYDYMKQERRQEVLMYCSETSAGYSFKGLVNDVSFELIEMKGDTSVPHIPAQPIPVTGEWTITFSPGTEGYGSGEWDVIGQSVFFTFKSNGIQYDYMYWSSVGEPSESDFFYNSTLVKDYSEGWVNTAYRTVYTDTDPATVFTGEWANFLAAYATVTHNT